MKSLSRWMFQSAVCLVAAASLQAADAPPLSAADLAARLSALQQDGTALVKLKMDTGKGSLQLQIKQRRSAGATDLVYQVLWPKERVGESVLLHKAGNQAGSGAVFTPPATVRTLDAAQMKEPLLGSDLSYADVLENFFAWDQQTIVGTEVVDRVSCQILESKPGKGERSAYASVRTWVDTRRLVPLRVEKYTSSGQAARRIETTRVVTDDMGRHIPANLTVRNLQSGSVTELDGSRLKHGVAFTDRDFTADALKEVTTPR